MQTIQRRIRRIRRAARFAQLGAFLWALTEVGFIALGIHLRDGDMIATHGCAFLFVTLMLWLMSTAASVFQQDILDAARAARTAVDAETGRR